MRGMVNRLGVADRLRLSLQLKTPMEYFQNRDSGKVYCSDSFGKNMLEIVKGERCVIPVCDIPATAVRLECTGEDVWKFVKDGLSTEIQTREDKSWRQRLMAWRGR